MYLIICNMAYETTTIWAESKKEVKTYLQSLSPYTLQDDISIYTIAKEHSISEFFTPEN